MITPPNSDGLNEKQKQSVTLSEDTSALILAGAGSGKTRVLTHRIHYLVSEKNYYSDDILAVTFTNKAANEMKERLSELLYQPIGRMWVGTFHSLAHRLLRAHAIDANLSPTFQILDAQDQFRIIKRLMKENGVDETKFPIRKVQWFINQQKDEGLQPHNIDAGYNFFVKQSTKIFDLYEKHCQANDLIDFAGLLMKSYELLKNNSSLLEHYQNKFKHILVDEFQDTNRIQYQFIKILHNENNHIFCVGDDDQSIYGWRGADINNILNFQNTYHDAKIVKLEENYRSTQNILDAAWSVVSRNKNRADKKLWTKNSEGDSINILKSYNERDEAIKIISDISKIKNDNDISYNKFLILYRTNAQSRVIEDALIKNGILYNIVGGVKFYDRKEVKDILAYMRFIVNPCDTISFDRIVNFPIRGIGKTTVEKIHAALSSDNIMESLAGFDKSAIGKKQSMALEEFYKMIQSYSKRSVEESPSGIIKDLLIDLKLKEFYMNQNTLDGEERWRNIEECISGIVDYEKNTDNPSLSGYLEEVSLFTDIDSWNDENDKITMMTIHSSKGLEFDYVYIAGLERGLFPIERAVEEGSIDEERRLFYVALTRAQKKVTLSYAKSRRRFGSEPIPSSKSPFITEIPSKLIDESIFKSQSKNRIYDNNITSDECLIKKNQIVYHKLFGKGKVENVEGSGINAKLTILFFNNTRKKLIYKYANLEVIK